MSRRCRRWSAWPVWRLRAVAPVDPIAERLVAAVGANRVARGSSKPLSVIVPMFVIVSGLPSLITCGPAGVSVGGWLPTVTMNVSLALLAVAVRGGDRHGVHSVVGIGVRADHAAGVAERADVEHGGRLVAAAVSPVDGRRVGIRIIGIHDVRQRRCAVQPLKSSSSPSRHALIRRPRTRGSLLMPFSPPCHPATRPAPPPSAAVMNAFTAAALSLPPSLDDQSNVSGSSPVAAVVISYVGSWP